MSELVPEDDVRERLDAATEAAKSQDCRCVTCVFLLALAKADADQNRVVSAACLVVSGPPFGQGGGSAP